MARVVRKSGHVVENACLIIRVDVVVALKGMNWLSYISREIARVRPHDEDIYLGCLQHGRKRAPVILVPCFVPAQLTAKGNKYLISSSARSVEGMLLVN